MDDTETSVEHSFNNPAKLGPKISEVSPAPTSPNLPQWNAISDYWDKTLGDGNSIEQPERMEDIYILNSR